MQNQFDPKWFIVRERSKFWSDTKRKPGETIQELTARIRQDAAKCDFTSIRDPQDKAMGTRFICAVNNVAGLKALFKINDDELTFTRAIQVVVDTEDAAKVAKETVMGPRTILFSSSRERITHLQGLKLKGTKQLVKALFQEAPVDDAVRQSILQRTVDSRMQSTVSVKRRDTLNLSVLQRRKASKRWDTSRRSLSK